MPSPCARQHVERPHDAKNATETGADRDFLKTQRLSCFIHKHRDFMVSGGGTQAAGAQTGIDDDGRAEGERQPFRFGVVEIGANLRVVGAMDGAGVEIDAMRGFANRLNSEPPSVTPIPDSRPWRRKSRRVTGRG